LGDNLRFPNAACAPDVQGHTFADQRVKRLIEFRWFHGMSSIDLKCAGKNLCSRELAGWNLVSFWIGRSAWKARFELQMG
jgi:hypothetical protein